MSLAHRGGTHKHACRATACDPRAVSISDQAFSTFVAEARKLRRFVVH